MNNRYTLAGLKKHTRGIRADSSSRCRTAPRHVGRPIRAFNLYFAALDQQTDVLRENVRKVLATSFFNHSVFGAATR